MTIYALTDAPLYAPNATLTVNGKAFEGTSGVASTAVSLRVWNSTAGTINTSSSSPTSSDGSFSANITAPSSEANYNVTVTIGTGNATLPFQVSAKTRVEIYIVNSTNMGFTVNLGSCNSSNYNSSEISGAVKCGNFSFSSATYYVLAQKSGSVFDRLFLDDDEVLNFTATEAGVPLQKFLSEGNSVAVGTLSLTILFIDPFGGMAVLGNLITPSFTGTAGENASLLAIPINGSGGPVTSGSLNLDFVDGNGTTLNSSTPGIPANGVFNATFNISTTGGTDYIRSDKSQVTYAVNKFYLRPAVRTSDGNDIASAAPGTALLMIASVVTSTTQTPITSGVTAWATIRWPNASVSNITLGFFSGTSAYNSTFTAPSIAGEYLAEFTAAYNGSTQAVTVPFEVSPYEVVVKPMAKGKDGASDGFPTNQPGMLLVGARNLSSGAFLDVASLTANCSTAYLRLLGIKNANGTDMMGNLSAIISGFGSAFYTPLSNFSAFVSQAFGEQMPPEVLEELNELAGSGACAVIFLAPPVSGAYTAEINTTIGGINRLTVQTVRVQQIFVNAFPMSSTGGFQPSVSPGQRVYLGISAYNPGTGRPIDSANITNAQLVEVNAEGTVVTSKMLNESFTTVAGFPAISFIVNDSAMGHHFVRFKITANINGSLVEAYGDGFFKEELYRVWTYPQMNFGPGSGGKFGGAFGSTDAVTMVVEVRDASGMNAQSGLTVTLSKVTQMDTFQTVNVTSSSSGTTDSGGRATIQINNSNGWQSGGYNVRVKVKDSSNNTDYGYGWFEVRNFMLFAYTNSFEVSTTQAISFNLFAKSFNGTAMNGTARISKVIYFGSANSWAPPTVVNSSISSTGTITNGDGNISLPAGSVSQSGQYAAVIEATSGGMTESTQAWFMAKPFTIFVEPADGNWESMYGIGATVRYRVKAYDSINWNTWPPSGTGHNLTAAYVGSVEKMGFWGQSYKTRSQLAQGNNVTSSCSQNICNLSFNTTGFTQGEYNIRVVANDSTGQTGEWNMFMRIQSVRITVPELYNGANGLTIDAANTARNATSISINGSCGSLTDEPIEPADVTNCKYASAQLFSMEMGGVPGGNWQSAYYGHTCFLLDKTNLTLWLVNSSTGPNNCSAPSGGSPSNTTNFSGLGAYRRLNVSDTFYDTNGSRWRISSIDFTQGVLYLQFADGVIGVFTDPQSNNMTFPIRLNQSKSRSGVVIFGKTGQETLRDQDWSMVDLDGDNQYNDDNYMVALSDSQTSGTYDTVFVANRTNLSAGVEIGAASTSGINFSANARPIFLLSIRYLASGLAGQYRLTLTTNRPGWGGMNIGTFRSGSLVKIPVSVTSPSNTTAYYNNTPVRLRGLTSVGGMKGGFMGSDNMITTSAGNCVGGSGLAGMACTYNTSAYGVALVVLNTSNITPALQSGSYSLVIEACTNASACWSADNWAGPNNDWERPQFEVRNFEVQGRFGNYGNISNIIKVSESAGTLQTAVADEFPVNGTIYTWGAGSCPNWDGTNCSRLSEFRYFDRIRLYRNASGTGAIRWGIDANGDGTPEEAYANSSPIVPATPWPVPVVGFNGQRALLNLTAFFANNGTFQFEIAWPGVLVDAKPSQWSDPNFGPSVRVSNLANNVSLVVLNGKGRITSQDKNGWEGPYDTAYVVSTINSTVFPGGSNRSFGALLPLISKSVLKAVMWEPVVLLTNASIGGNYPKTNPWSCDSPVFWVGNFTEASSNMMVREQTGGMESSALDPVTQYYIWFFDSQCDGVSSVTNAIISPYTDFSTDWVNNGTCNMPWDYDGPSQLANVSCNWNPNAQRKQWIEVGRDSWPFSIIMTNFSSSTGLAYLFKEAWPPFNTSRLLNLFVSAKYFDGTAVSGNVSVDSVTGFNNGFMGGGDMGGGGPEGGGMMMGGEPQEVRQNVTGFANVTNGNGFLYLNISNLTGDMGGYYSAKFVVRESQAGQTESLQREIGVMGGPGMGGGGGGQGGP